MTVALEEHKRGAHDALRVEAVVAVEVLVLGGDEGLFYAVGDRRRGQIEPAFARIFGEQAAILGVYAGHHRRLIVFERAVIGQVLLVMVDHRSGDRGADHEKNRGGREKKPEKAADRLHAFFPRATRVRGANPYSLFSPRCQESRRAPKWSVGRDCGETMDR